MRVENLSMNYGNVKALKGVNFEFNTPAFIGVIGHNGSGKTTLLESMMGLRKPTDGIIDVSKEIGEHTIQEKLGVVLQENNFYENIKVKELLNLFATYYDDTYDVDYLMEVLGITPYKFRYYHKLSGGMKQKVNLALAFLNKPKIVILDEPTTGLDPFARKEFWDALKTLCNDTLLFLSSHYMEEVQENCSHILFLKNGEKIYSGFLKDLLAQENSNNLSEIYLKLSGGKSHVMGTTEDRI